MRTLACAFLVLPVLALSPLCGQTPRLAFDVASIRPNASHSQAIGGTYGIRPGGRISVRNVTILDLICLAYRVRHYQVSGGPSWLSTRRFDVQAQPGRNVSEDDGRRMLQTLLADRFDLAIHRVSRRVRGYSMHLPKGSGKLRMSTTPEAESGFAIMSTREMRGESVSMRTLAHALTEILGSPVEDRTGAASRYRMAFQWTPDELSAAGEPGPSVFSVLWEELGVKLKPDRVEVEGIVVDRVRENPTEN